jgi:hypothetical protein
VRDGPNPSAAALPRTIECDAGHDAIRARLSAGTRRLWSGGGATVPVLPFGPALADALGVAGRNGQLVLGLERVEETLEAEARGLALTARRSGAAPSTRVSRLLLVTNDGAERLYRHAERLAVAHAPRVLVAMLGVDAATIGRASTGRKALVKVVLVRHKLAVAALLRALTA